MALSTRGKGQPAKQIGSARCRTRFTSLRRIITPRRGSLMIRPSAQGGALCLGHSGDDRHARAVIPNARQGFRLLFSAEPFPGYQSELKWMKGEFGGHWYRWAAHDMEGWLCPALFKYFLSQPPALYARAEPLSR